MELVLIIVAIGGGLYWYSNHSPQAKLKRQVAAADKLIKESDEAYVYLANYLKEILEKDYPRWVKEAKENLATFKRDFPKQKAPDLLTYQPEKQAARKAEYLAEQEDLMRVKDKFLRVAIRFEHSEDAKKRLENIYDWHQWISRKADAAGRLGLWEGLYANDEEQTAWAIKYEEIERRFDERLK